MTAAGVGSLLICDRQLAPYRVNVKNLHPLLTPLDVEGDRKKYQPELPPKRLNQGIAAGINWLGLNFTTSNAALIGHSAYYALYGIERMGALADQATLGRRDWFAEGRKFLAATQSPGGNFSAQYGEGPNTAWAVLFLTKATSKTIRKIQLRRLGAGTLIGGRGLPSDLSQVSVAGGKIIARPMDGAVEEMLGTLEDPRVEDASAALAGLIGRYRTEGTKALRPFQDRFRKLLTDQDQGIRRVAAWALARTGDTAMALPLIDALRDPDKGVVAQAREGLELLSRKILGYGPPDGATPEQRDAAILRWRDWYESSIPPTSTEGGAGREPGPVRPDDPEGPVNSTPTDPTPAAARIYGESVYDRVTSMLLAVVLGALLVFGWLSLIAATTSAYQARVTRPIEVIEVSGGGGGTPDGKPASLEAVDVAGGEASDRASNNEEDASQFEEPTVETRPSAMLDVAEAGQSLAEVDVSTVMPRGERVATGKRRSKVGNGGPGFGFGPGDGGVRREDRWSILYKTGQTADEYARQLDAFGVEMAIISGNQLAYVSKFAQAPADPASRQPDHR